MQVNGIIEDKDFGLFEAIHESLQNDKVEWFSEVIRLPGGMSFGEKALIDDAPRAANIIALQHSCFAVTGREDFKKCLQRIEQRATTKKMEFFKNFPFM